MAIALTALTVTTSSVDRTYPDVYTSASFPTAPATVPANALVLLTILGRNAAAAPPNNPVLGGTFPGPWTLVNSHVMEATSGDRNRLWVYRSLAATARSGVLTVGPSVSEGWLNAVFSVVAFSGIDTSGTNGSGAVAQSVINRLTVASTSFVVTLGAFASADNRPYLAVGTRVASNTNFVPGVNFTEIHELGPSSEVNQLFVEWSETVVDTTASVSWSGSSANICGVALELRAAPVVPLELLHNAAYPTRVPHRRPVAREGHTVYPSVLIDPVVVPEVENFPCTTVYL